MVSWHWRKLSAALGMSALILAACGSTTSTSKATPTKTSSSSSSSTVVDGIFEEPNLLNPVLGPSMTYSEMVETTLFRNLFMVQPDGSLATDLATSIPTVSNGGISKDGLHYTITIRSDANWTNGKPVSVQDVITTWKMVTNPKVTAFSTVGWADIQSIKALSQKKMEVTLKHPDAGFLVDAFGREPSIIPASVFAKMTPSQFNTASFNHDPTVTDGPFMFKHWSAGASITVVRNPHWYGPKVQSKQIVFKVIPSDNTLLANAQAHEINVYYFDPIEQVKELKAIKGAKVHFTTQPAYEAGRVNFRDKQLQDVRVRQALEMALNRSQIATKVWQGHATPIAADASPDQWSYDASLKPYPYDPTKAKSLLKQAGYTMGSNGYLQKNGKTLSIVWSTTAGNPWREASERLDQYNLKQIGVKMIIKNYPANAFFGSVLPSGKGWDIGEAENGEGPDPLATLQPYWTCGAVENFGGYCNHKYDSLITKAASQVTVKQQQPYVFQAEKILHDQLPNLWLYSPAEIDTSINMTGYKPNPYSVDTWNAWDWKVTN